jgi:uncharacterized repeat protein (TIGR03803 family)
LGNFWGTTQAGGADAGGTVFKISASSGVITSVVDFATTTTGDNRGGFPSAGLVSDGAGNFWGTTQQGGVNRYGTVFMVNVSTGAITTVVDFDGGATDNNRGGTPLAALVSDGAGNLWGTTTAFGANNQGTIFKVNAATGAMTTVADVPFGGAAPNQSTFPGAALVSDGLGNFWGTTPAGGAHDRGSVFKINASSGAITTVIDFADSTTGNNRGNDPTAALLSDGDGNFWGTTARGGVYGQGTLFEVNVSTGAITTLVDFAGAMTGANRGGQPLAPLVSDGAGNLWGTTATGGASGEGTVFEVNASSGAITTVTDFADVATGANRGGYPYAALVSDGAGNFWGTTWSGGAAGAGTVFEVNAGTGAVTTVADFDSFPAGSPLAGLLNDGAGYLWGTASAGGTYGRGAVFKMNINTGTVTDVVSFANSTTAAKRGNLPYAGLTSDGAGNFWGTAYAGGASTAGTLFEINASTGVIMTLVDFANSTAGANRGGFPVGTLVSDGAGNLWGSTATGGMYSEGTIYKVNTSTGVITTVVDFAGHGVNGNRGSEPLATLVSDGAGNFWGVTAGGGTNTDGTLFKVNISTGAITAVVDFTSSTTAANRGASPEGALVSDGAGNFWGTTASGGANGGGTIFQVNATTGVITTFVDFANSTTGANRGGFPRASLVSDGTGNLWSTTYQGGAFGKGTIFEINVSTGAITTVFDFTNASGAVPGAAPVGALLLTQDGFYGTASMGGVTAGGAAGGTGEIFYIDFGPNIAAITASQITTGGGTLSGSANPQGVATSVYVQYGITPSYGSQTSSMPLGSGSTSVPYSIPLSGLSPGTPYYYQLVFVTPNGNFYSTGQSFTTAAGVPALPPWGLPVLTLGIIALAQRSLSRRARKSADA